MEQDTKNTEESALGQAQQPLEFDGLDQAKISPSELIDRWWKIGICAVLLALFFREELIRLVDRWITDTRESHGLLIPAFSLYFLYLERHRLARTAGNVNWLGLIVMILSLVGYSFSVWKQFYYPRQLMIISMCVGVVLLLGGWRILRLSWLPICYLVFAMPLPARIYTAITMPLRELASSIAAVLLSQFPGIDTEALGVVIHGWHTTDAGTEMIQLNVAEACSGMRLLLTFVALGVAMAYLEKRPALHRIVLLCSTIPIAIFCNMLRVVLTGLIHVFVGSQYATGTLHSLLGIVMLVVAFGLYGLLAWTMNNLFIDDDEPPEVLVIQSAREKPPS